ncbi:MAG: hypothetical protein IJU52_08135, partial [Clostridia bacterium]|nr:hypothetical protein [Clostridia bacterium]
MKKALSIVLTLIMITSLFTVFAVSADASDGILIDYGSDWDYVYYEEDPNVGITHTAPDGWLDGSDNETWQTATAPIGPKWWGDPASRLPVQYYIAFFRHDFTISDISKITSLTMYIKYDEN